LLLALALFALCAEPGEGAAGCSRGGAAVIVQPDGAAVQIKTSEDAVKTKSGVKILQFNMLADGLAFDGLLCKGPGEDTGKFVELMRNIAKHIGDLKEAAQKKAGDAKVERKHLESVRDAGGGFGGIFDTEVVAHQTEMEKLLLTWGPHDDGRLGRGMKIVDMIVKSGADIVTLQEIDQYAFLAEELEKQGYTSVIKKSGTQADYGQLQEERLKILDSLKGTQQVTAYLAQVQRLANEGFAFAPNLQSNSRKFAMKRKIKANFDDQGVAIFWKALVFEMTEKPSMTPIGTDAKNDAHALKVVLTGAAGGPHDGKKLAVVTTHLSSGAEKELRRHWELNDIYQKLIVGEIRPLIFAGDLNSEIWFDKDAEKVKKGKLEHELKTTCFDMITSDGTAEEFHQHYDKKKGTGPIKADGVGVETIQKWNMKSVWDPKGENPATVFKMRGPGGNQPSKMGELALETIDHIFYNGLTKKKVVVWGGGDDGWDSTPSWNSMNKEKLGKMKKLPDDHQEFFGNMIPSEKVPSDHFPVLAEFDFDEVRIGL